MALHLNKDDESLLLILHWSGNSVYDCNCLVRVSLHDCVLGRWCKAKLNSNSRSIMLLLGQNLTKVDLQGSNGGLPPDTHSLQNQSYIKKRTVYSIWHHLPCSFNNNSQ